MSSVQTLLAPVHMHYVQLNVFHALLRTTSQFVSTLLRANDVGIPVSKTAVWMDIDPIWPILAEAQRGHALSNNVAGDIERWMRRNTHDWCFYSIHDIAMLHTFALGVALAGHDKEKSSGWLTKTSHVEPENEPRYLVANQNERLSSK